MTKSRKLGMGGKALANRIVPTPDDAFLGTGSSRAQIVRVLRAAIISGEMEPDIIYSAPCLAAQFGVSPTPVREAMIDLAKEQLVEIVKNKGFRVTRPDIQQLRNMLELRLLLEVPMTRRIAEHGISKSQSNALRPMADEGLRAAQRGDFVGLVAADMGFHLTLLGFAGNPELVEVVRVLRSRSRLAGLRSETMRMTLTASAYEHLELLELIENADVLAVEGLIRRHIAHVGSGFPI